MGRDPDAWWLDETVTAGREHFDEDHSRRYDRKMDAGARDEVALLRGLGVIGPQSCIVDLGAGTGQFALAASAQCGRVVAVDVSPVMLARLREKVADGCASNVEIVHAGFLSYEHRGAPADAVYSRFALHHLPDFWKAVAIARIAQMLRPGGVFRLSDVVYSFAPQEADERIESWISDNMSADVDGGWTRAEMAEHVRDEHSTLTWLLEPLIERAGFDIVDADFSSDQMLASYVCAKR
jgi:ubiquinone/menaquinone biosynthesis C-methylase UbiE